MQLPQHLRSQEQRSIFKCRICRAISKKKIAYINLMLFVLLLFSLFMVYYKQNSNANTIFGRTTTTDSLQNEIKDNQLSNARNPTVQHPEIEDQKIGKETPFGKDPNITQSAQSQSPENEHTKTSKKLQFKTDEDINEKEIDILHPKNDFYNDLSPFSLYELYYPDDSDQKPSEWSIEKCSQYSYSGTSLNSVPSEEQSNIEDPYDYVHQPPERPLIPRNFNQDIQGVHNLEISPGVIVPHNFSGIQTRKVVKFANHSINVTTFDSGNIKEHFVWLPPFDWKIPHGLTKDQLELFFKQPENHWHFNDCKMWNINVIWEVKNGVSTISNHMKCTNHNYTNNLNFCEWPKTLPHGKQPAMKGDVFAFGGHYIEIFQHFFDNGISHMAAMAFALGLERISNITLFSAGRGSTCQSIMHRIGFKDVRGSQSTGTEISAENLIVIPSMRVLHPYYFEFFRYNMDKSPPKLTLDEKIAKYRLLFGVENVTEEEIDQKNKVFILPRGKGSGGNARIIYNIDDVVNRLKEVHGDKNVVVYRSGGEHRINSIDDMRFFFSRAKAIVAPHGGACYNHFFADKGIDFVEMIPILHTGKYPRQNHWNKLIPFAHLAFLSSVQLHSQRFWRYLSMDADINYNVDVDDFMKWAQQISSLARSGSTGYVELDNN